MEQLGFKESLEESKILSGLDKNKKDNWKKLPLKDKKYFVDLFKNTGRKEKQSFYIQLDETFDKYKDMDQSDLKSLDIVEFFKKQGIAEPSSTTVEAFKYQEIPADFNNAINTLSTLTMDRAKQAQFTYYITQQKQNFIAIAQNDKLIKQNQKLTEQNEEIIQLLKAIADK